MICRVVYLSIRRPCISDDVLLYYLEAPEVMELAEDDPSILEYEQLKNLKEDDNPVLMIVYLK